MSARAHASTLARLLLTLGLLALSPGTARAVVIPEGSGDPLESLAFVSGKLRSQTVPEPFEAVESTLEPEVRDGWASFRAGQRGEWRAHVDARNGRIDFAEGAGIPWVPGHGNALTRQDVSDYLNARREINLGSLEKIARGFLPRVAHLLGVNPSSLVLNQGRSGQQADYLWFVDFDIQRDGLPVEGARVVFRVNNGNLIQFGTENLPAINVPTPRGKLQREAALARLADFIGGFQAGDTFFDNGSMRLLTVAREDPGFAEGFRFGDGRGLAAVWQFTFRRDRSHATWHARVDADSGEILELKDVNRYVSASGGVKISDDIWNLPKPMPFTNTGLAFPNNYTNSAGVYNYPGGAATSTLNGLYVRASDACGITSLAADTSGNLKFGPASNTANGTDCTTPGFGGAGNTTASRTQFYLLNRAREVARGWLPGNEWLDSQLTANVNMNATCNAFWNGITVNFYRSGGGCGNTGEIEAISLHEYGHGLDANDGNFDFTDNATGETYGDFTAALATRRSCIGPGFRTTTCGGYGDACTSCTGVRDIDWGGHTSNTPHTVANFTQTRCPTHATYLGPCGREGHCESYVSSEALWDFVARDQPPWNAPTSWAVAERLWYLSRSTATEAFTCNPSGTWTSDGCNTGSLWRTLRAVDDDDGNLSNGTPHGGALFAAFNRHGIACTTDAGASTTFRGCVQPTVPTLTVTGGINSATATWTSSGTGMVYDVYRSDRFSDAGLIKIADDISGISFTEDGIANDIRYYYQVVAHPPGNEACAADPTGNRSTIPCIPPPAGLAAAAAGQTQINLSWNAVADATSYVVYRSTTSGGPYTQIASGITGTTFSSTGLSCGTTYFYVVQAEMRLCKSANSNQASAATTITVIAAPTGLTAATTGQPQINLSWNTVAGATSYNVYRSMTSGGPYTQIASGITGMTFSSTGLSCGTTYYYVVRAVSSAGCESANSNQATAATPTTVTAAPTGLTANAAGQTQINLSWNAVAGAASYNVYRSTSSGGTYTKIASNIPGTTFSNTGLSCGTYYYAVRTVSSAGCESANSNQASALATTMPTPTGLTAAAASPIQIDLSWNAVAGATSYRVERSFTSGGLYATIGGATGTTLSDTNLSCGTTYFYAVQAVAGGCSSANSVQASAATPALTAPTGLTAVAAGQTQINLSWNAVAGVTTYNVYRSTTSGGSYTKIATNVPGTTFSNTDPSCGMPYFYVVRAVANSSCESANSNQVSAATATTTPAPTGLTAAAAGPAQINLSWNAVTGASSYYVYRSTTSGGPYGLLANVAGTTVSSTNLTCGNTYFYVVRAYKSVDGCLSADSNQASAATPALPAPTGLTAAAAGQTQINLSWNAVAGANTYSVYRSTTSGGSYIKIANSIPGTTFSSTGLSCGTTYFYVVQAEVGNNCATANSNQASAATTCTALSSNDFESGTAGPTGATTALSPPVHRELVRHPDLHRADRHPANRAPLRGVPFERLPSSTARRVRQSEPVLQPSEVQVPEGLQVKASVAVERDRYQSRSATAHRVGFDLVRRLATGRRDVGLFDRGPLRERPR
ncbi:MAG TPA: hypothetical protein VKK31_31320 [Thermoanaerobaculia bacterium]|nr:hypothetical protein [Thermoanaerobaculia bacterium]